VNYDRAEKVLKFTLGLPEVKQAELPKLTATGTTDLFLLEKNKPGIFGKVDRSYVTEEIPHGLGAGPVLITVGLEASDSLLTEQQSVIYGDAEAFHGTTFAPELPKHTVGTLVYPHRGTFRIGVRLMEPAEQGSLRIRWWATRADVQGVPAQTQEIAQPKLEAAAGTNEAQDAPPLE
jgi:hypothetical protein